MKWPSITVFTDLRRSLLGDFFQPKKKKDKSQMKQIVSASDMAYGTLNVKVSGYDMTVVEHYSQYIHNLCNRLGIKVAERWGRARWLQKAFSTSLWASADSIYEHWRTWSAPSVGGDHLTVWQYTGFPPLPSL